MPKPMEDLVPAHWEEVNGGPYIHADDLLAYMKGLGMGNFTTVTMAQWILNAKAQRLDQVADAISDADVPSLKRDLIALRDELADDLAQEGP